MRVTISYVLDRGEPLDVTLNISMLGSPEIYRRMAQELADGRPDFSGMVWPGRCAVPG
ncbi:hypothetical protein [Micromonospora sp. NPDC005206]|uniref:hypothetical protein n=1 Tax=Micromonospora sp. NPDC005206 TaxID=3157022 RepID=UPI0033A03B88